MYNLLIFVFFKKLNKSDSQVIWDQSTRFVFSEDIYKFGSGHSIGSREPINHDVI